MSEAILLLQLEHKHADALLGVIEQQLDADSGPDLGLLRSVAEYFRDYPDTCHHPVEDRVYRKLAERDPQMAAGIGTLQEDHVHMSQLSADFVAAVDRAQRRGAAEPDALRESARRFVERNRAHMCAEEEHFFPAALATLTDDDWAEIEYDLFDRADPLFESEVEKKYEGLRAQIARQAVTSRRRAAFLRQLGRLRRLESVTAFNALMAERGESTRLVAHEHGGFGLERDGRILVDIPKCSPGRAAWCAFYYLGMPPAGAAPAS